MLTAIEIIVGMQISVMLVLLNLSIQTSKLATVIKLMENRCPIFTGKEIKV